MPLSMAAAMSAMPALSRVGAVANIRRSILSYRRLPPFSWFRSSSVRVLPGLPYPLGATCDGRGTNFALFSAHAEKVELCLFDNYGRRELGRVVLLERTEDVWHV